MLKSTAVWQHVAKLQMHIYFNREIHSKKFPTNTSAPNEIMYTLTPNERNYVHFNSKSLETTQVHCRELIK